MVLLTVYTQLVDRLHKLLMHLHAPYHARLLVGATLLLSLLLQDHRRQQAQQALGIQVFRLPCISQDYSCTGLIRLFAHSAGSMQGG